MKKEGSMVIAYFLDHLPENTPVLYNNFIIESFSKKEVGQIENYQDLLKFTPNWFNLNLKLKSSGFFTNKRAEQVQIMIENFFIYKFLLHNHEIYESRLSKKILIISPFSDLANSKITGSSIQVFNPNHINRNPYSKESLLHCAILLGKSDTRDITLNLSSNNSLIDMTASQLFSIDLDTPLKMYVKL